MRVPCLAGRIFNGAAQPQIQKILAKSLSQSNPDAMSLARQPAKQTCGSSWANRPRRLPAFGSGFLLRQNISKELRIPGGQAACEASIL